MRTPMAAPAAAPPITILVEGTAPLWREGWTEGLAPLTPVTLRTLEPWAGELLRIERVARLAYVDDHERPRVLPVTFAVEGDAVWSAIDEKPKRTPEPARLRHLQLRPKAALLVDVYDDDWSKLAWVQLLGTVAIVPAEGEPEAIAALAAKYRQYAERTPPGPLLRLSVERALQWRAAGGPHSAGSPRRDHSLQEPG
jgi:PPOX class probable F420-dependent enzyme